MSEINDLKTMDLAVRPMVIADLSDVVAIHRESFPDSRSSRLGDAFLRKMYRWYMTYYPELAFVAMINSRVVGFVTGAASGSGRRRFRYTLLEILWGIFSHPRLLFRADMFELWPSYLMGLLPKYRNARNSASSDNIPVKVKLDSIAVRQSARGCNVGKSLMYAFEQATQKLGVTLLVLGVEIDNTAARRLYESCGWVLVQEDATNNSASYVKEIQKV